MRCLKYLNNLLFAITIEKSRSLDALVTISCPHYVDRQGGGEAECYQVLHVIRHSLTFSEVSPFLVTLTVITLLVPKMSLASLTRRPPNRPNWTFQQKLDLAKCD